jgi:hypothetical protein
MADMSGQVGEAAIVVLRRSALRQIELLTVQFVLGMGANFIGSGVKGFAEIAGTTVVVLHIAVAITLLLLAITTTTAAAKVSSSAKRAAYLAAGTIAVTFIAGLLTLLTGSNWWSFAMAVGFMAALLLYGKLYVDRAITGLSRSNR